MEEEKIIDQTALAEDVSNKIKYEFIDFFMVKPLDPIKIKKEISTPVTDGKVVEDKNGVKAEDFDGVKTEIKEVDSDYRKGVVIKLPIYYKEDTIKVGDIVLFRDRAGLGFDLLKDSRLLRQYDILGIER